MSCNQNQQLADILIKNAWESGRLACAYLFFGPPGTGRLFLARSLAKTVNCQAGTFPPCMACSACIRIENNNYPDVHYLGKENSNFIKIEQIHQMQKEINLSPFEGKYKVFIMLNTEDLTSEAANCLLKILEEPPKDSLIILIASDLRRIFPTIISRCQRIKFNPKDPHQVEAILNQDYHLDKEVSHFLAFCFEGRLGEALSFKGNDILSEKNQIIRQFIINPGLSPDRLDYKDKENINWVLKILIGCLRDIYLLKIGLEGVGLINQDIRNELYALTKKFSFSDLDRILRELCAGLENIRQNINPRLLVDNLQLLWRK
ncbi:MAG: DNA polymerase III subunit delta' [Candidatus Omnitrophota bacterium]|jgi:DNA polymerase-3 subunit delta'